MGPLRYLSRARDVDDLLDWHDNDRSITIASGAGRPHNRVHGGICVRFVDQHRDADSRSHVIYTPGAATQQYGAALRVLLCRVARSEAAVGNRRHRELDLRQLVTPDDRLNALHDNAPPFQFARLVADISHPRCHHGVSRRLPPCETLIAERQTSRRVRRRRQSCWKPSGLDHRSSRAFVELGELSRASSSAQRDSSERRSRASLPRSALPPPLGAPVRPRAMHHFLARGPSRFSPTRG